MTLVHLACTAVPEVIISDHGVITVRTESGAAIISGPATVSGPELHDPAISAEIVRALADRCSRWVRDHGDRA